MRKTRIAAAVAVVLLSAAGYIALRYPATLRNVYEDSWWQDAPHRESYTAWPSFDSKRERLYRIEQLAEERKWAEVLPVANELMEELRGCKGEEDRVLAAIAMRYAMLAESCLGTLASHFMRYPVHSPEDFVMFRYRSRDACLFNLFFFRELGLPDEVFHQAMEYPLAFTDCTHRSMRLMAEAARQSGDHGVAKKLARVAELETATDQDGTASPQDPQDSTGVLRSKLFVFGDPMVRVFLTLLNEDMSNRRLFDYAALSFIVMGQRDKCRQLLNLCPVYNEHNLPSIYR